MIFNISLESYDLFSWDDDELLWNAFTSPSAFIIYKWSAIIIFLFYMDIVSFLGLFALALIWTSAAIPILIHYGSGIISRKYAKYGEKPLQQFFIQCNKLCSWLWHGYEVVGLENIPEDKPIVFYIYHGVFSMDGGYISTVLMELYGEKVIISGNKKTVNLFGLKRLHRLLNYLAYNREDVIEHLNGGGYFLTAVGGTEERRLSDNNYRVTFGGRQGLAHVLKSVNKPVALIPIFTRNIQEAFWIPWFVKIFFKYLPIWLQAAFPPVGGLPVKLTTFIGKEVEYDLSKTPIEIVDKLKDGLQLHVDSHQIVPGNRWRALQERFCPSKYSHTIEV